MPDSATPPVAQPASAPPATPTAPSAAPSVAPATAPTLLDQAKPPEPVKSEDVVVKFPKEVEINNERLAKFTTLAKEIGLKSDSAQKVADFYVEMQRASAEEHVATITKWGKDAETDKEFGGAAFKENLSVAQRAAAKVASPELMALLNETGLGNHPEMIRLFYKIGKTISEDKLPRSPAGGEGEPTIDDLMKQAYPNSPTMWGNTK